MNDFDTKDEGISCIYMKEISDYSETEYTYWGDYDTDPERGIHFHMILRNLEYSNYRVDNNLYSYKQNKEF